MPDTLTLVVHTCPRCGKTIQADIDAAADCYGGDGVLESHPRRRMTTR